MLTRQPIGAEAAANRNPALSRGTAPAGPPAPQPMPVPRLKPGIIFRKGTKFDARLDTTTCDRYNNAELTLVMRIHFTANNPAGGAETGQFHDYNDARRPARNVLRWEPNGWSAWKRTFISQAQAFWTDRLWLCNDVHAIEFTDRGTLYYPNIWCRFRLEEATSAAAAHHSVIVNRLAPGQNMMGSNTRWFDSGDIDHARKGVTPGGKALMQRASVHEIGHLLGLPHVNYGTAPCVGTNINDPTCYGVTDDQLLSVMGAGEILRTSDAEPWRDVAKRIAPACMPVKATSWPAKLKRHYPRTAVEIAEGKHVTARPSRG